MQRLLLALYLGAGSLWLTNCAAQKLRPTTPPVLQNRTTPTALERYQTLLNTYQTAVNENDLERARVSRNAAVNLVLAEIENVYREFETKLFANHAGFHIGADALELALASVATVSNGERGKSILAAVLSGATGLRLSIDKNLFQQQTVQAVIAAMRSNRDRLRMRIHSLLQGQTVEAYSFEAARADLAELFYAGTLQGALQQLHQQASAEAEAQQQSLDRVLMAAVTETDLVNARALRAALVAAMATPQGREQVREFLQILGVDNADSLDGAELENALRTVLRDIDRPEARTRLFEAAQQASLIE